MPGTNEGKKIMAGLIEYLKSKWNRRFATTAEEKFPPRTNHQKEYREKFDNIVDQYLISCEIKGSGDKFIVYIDEENDIDWSCERQFLEGEEAIKFHQSIAKLDIAHALPVQNLSHREIVTFKKILGVGYNAALHGNWELVDMAISKAEKYRDDRNKERSRLMLLSAATLYLFVLVGMFLVFFHCAATHPHMNLFWGIMMGSVGAYVSIWTRYGRMDMTGLGTPSIHYLEAFARMLIGAIFATIIIFAFKSGVVLNDVMSNSSERLVFGLIGFFAGFSEKWVPSVMERFVTNEKSNKE